MKKKLNVLSVLLLFVIAIASVIVINLVSDLKEENKELTQELENLKNADSMSQEVYQQTEHYLKALMDGDASKYLTDRFKQEAEEMDSGSSHETADLEELEIYNISVRPQDDDSYMAYAIYLAQLGGVDVETENPAHYRSMLLTSKITFKKENGELKVDNSELQPIETSEKFFEELLKN
ncbi:hypothetical protein [Virgibacillus salexigens]|uniref:Uncharacterized protein n=1 Tax=Virgibacillus kapii TaxID=1638645 RepID=A0ABQ2DXZ8_9BACI|nr:hypothetical protein [Virgibacillus kapii]GGJ77371.1 hypothetical protein GCM10007111_43720 [Virgibacillus kapii]